MISSNEMLIRLVLVGCLGFGLGCGGNEAADVAGETEALAAPVLSPDLSALGESAGRPASVQLPSSYDSSGSWPLVILLHGYGATGYIQDAYFGVSGRVDEDGFILIIPEGTVNGQNKQFWNATAACCDFYRQQPDDVGYLVGLVDEAKARYSVDAKRVYLIGHSNGGFMSYRMACEAGDVVAGIASLAGSGFLEEASCVGNEPVTILQIHGTQDATIPYGGSEFYPGAVELVERWRGRNHCPQLEPTGAIGIESTLEGDETGVSLASGCDDGTSVALWTIDGGSHIPAFQSDFVRLTLQFLLGHQKP